MGVTKRTALAFTVVYIISHSAKLIVEACDGHSNHADPFFYRQDETVQDGRNLIEYDIRSDDYSWSIEKDFQEVGARCMTPDADEDEIAEISRIVENWKEQNLRYEVLKIPLYIHVMENEDGDGAVSDVQINDQVDAMNAAFGPDIQYVLQEKKVTVNNEWHRCELGKSEKDMKESLRRGGSESLNIYLCEPIGLLGWATLPTKYEVDPSYDGVVVHTESIPGGRLAPYNLGYTAVHETGHWVGLRHTFQNGCDGVGDKIADTPAESSPAYGCPVGRDSCQDSDGEDPVNNFMNYSDDSCMTEFTRGQTVAMIATYINLRAVPGSIQEIQDDDDSGDSANSTSDSIFQQSETTGSNNVDDGSEPSESQVGGGSTSESTATDNSFFGAFSSLFGSSPSASSGSAGGSGFGFQQSNAGTNSFQGSIFGGFGSGDDGGGGGGLYTVAPQADIFTFASLAAPSPTTTDSESCPSLKSKGDSCSGSSQCCSGVCSGMFFFYRKCV